MNDWVCWCCVNVFDGDDGCFGVSSNDGVCQFVFVYCHVCCVYGEEFCCVDGGVVREACFECCLRLLLSLVEDSSSCCGMFVFGAVSEYDVVVVVFLDELDEVLLDFCLC